MSLNDTLFNASKLWLLESQIVLHSNDYVYFKRILNYNINFYLWYI